MRHTHVIGLAVGLALFGCNEGAQEARTLEASCEAGDASACDQLGQRLTRGDQVLLDWRRASELFMESCEADVPEACVRLAMLHVNEDAQEWGIPHDSARAVALLDRGCSEGAAVGCSGLADMYADSDSIEADVEPRGVLQDFARAAELFSQGCDGGDAPGCSRLGLLVEAGTGIEMDSTRAAQLHQQSCDGGSEFGCAHLGRSYELGLGVGQDIGRAAELYEDACGTDKTGCFYWAHLFASGTGVELDYDRAVELYNEACYSRWRRGEGAPPIAEACFRAGELIADERVEARDSYAAIRQFRRACRLGFQEACARV